jgi:molybdopterin molybdotransferase
MPEFFNVLPPDEARALLLSHLKRAPGTEPVATAGALGRVLAADLAAPASLPSFRRSTMDGYAVRAADTFGASESLPAFLRVVGEVAMGAAPDVTLRPGECAVVHTGSALPDTADAVVQIEHTQAVGEGGAPPFDLEVGRSVAVGQNVLQIGEDVESGSTLFQAGHVLRPQDLGGLLALGLVRVEVAARPRVAILATGDEVVAPEQEPRPGQIRDINSYTIAALAQGAGAAPDVRGIIPDRFEALLEAARDALAAADMVVMTAGSSVSVRDMTVRVIGELGRPGVLFHGVATRPGKPTIGGVVDGVPVLGLPGNPVSAMIQFEMFGMPAINHLLGRRDEGPRRVVVARLAQNVASESGREDYVPVRLVMQAGETLAIPVFGKSNLIYTLVNADGVIKVPLNKAGLLAGEAVEVVLT